MKLVGKDGTISTEPRSRAFRIARLIEVATETLGTAEKASQWLQTPNQALNGAIPIELLDTETGVDAVLTILGRIAHGIYS